MTPRAVLVGLPGSGKSTIGRRLAKALGVGLLDTDAVIEQQTGRSIAGIFAAGGEQEFRRIEETVVCAALTGHDGILSLGGGAVTIPGVRRALAGHTVVFLDVTAAEGVRRTSGSTARPLLDGPDRAARFEELMQQRVPLYRRVATIRADTTRRNPGAVARYIASRLAERLENSDDDGAVHRCRPSWCRSPTPPSPTPPPPVPPPSASLTGRPAPEAGDSPADAGPPPTPATLAARLARAGTVKAKAGT
jgi:shikimate kinase